MAHSKNYNQTELRKYSIYKTERGIRIDINYEVLGKLLDEAQFALDTQVWHDMQRYMPRKYGHLINMTNKLNQISAGTGEVHVYDPAVEYAHYVYEGQKYVDPVYRVGGFFGILPDKEGQWWSRKGVRKVPSGEPLQYTNPNATRHWDETAINNHMQDWVAVVRRVLEQGDKK